jgi:hypothetical protein
MIANVYNEVVKKIYGLLLDLKYPWALTGSLGMALQGMDIDVHDIDIQTDRDGAYCIQNRFSEYTVKNVRFSEAPNIRSHFGEFEIDGLKVEVMGDIEKRIIDGTWQATPDLHLIIKNVKIGEMLVPVIDLEYERDAYALLGRLEKARRLEEFLRSSE